MAISVSVVLFGALRGIAGGGRLTLELPDGATVADALAAAGLPDRVDIWALRDGGKVERSAALADGAEVTFFQPVGGG